MSVSKPLFEAACTHFLSDQARLIEGWKTITYDRDANSDPELCYTGLVCSDLPLSGPGIAEGTTADVQIALSPLYEVPMLCFTAYRHAHTGARPLSASEFLEKGASGEAEESSASAHVSVLPHPVTQAYTLAVHPCETQSTLKLLRATPASPHYLTAFLSVVGPPVGLPSSLCLPLAWANEPSSSAT